MTVESIMSRRVVTVGPDDTLATVRALFLRHGFHHLLVVEDGKLVGVLSDRDLLRALSPMLGTFSETTRDADTLNKRAHQVMSRNIKALKAASSLDEAIDILASPASVSCLPVVDEQSRPVGIVSWRDLLRAWRAGRT
jgi:acetoin utilization protein AcuB